MKAKLLFFGISVLTMITLFYSCSKNDNTMPPGPATLTFNPDTASFEGLPGATWSFTVTATAPSGFDSLYIEKQVGTGSPTEYASVTSATDNSATYNFSYTLSADEVGETVTFTFTLVETGTSGASATKTIMTDSPPARSYTAILLYAPLSPDKSANSFFSTSTGATYSPDSVNATNDPLSADIDFGYYYGATDLASLASPLAYSKLSDTDLKSQVAGWGTLNDITFKTTSITSSQFTEMSTFADIDQAFASGTASTTAGVVTKLAVGQVIAFQTDASKSGGSIKGLIMVDDIQGTYNEGDHIKLDILVEEPAE